MITVTEIQKKSKRKYEEVLQFSLNGESCFPLEIRSNKVLSKDFIQMSKEIAEVLGGSKDRKGFGYSVVSETIKTRQHGVQDIPKSIQFDTLDDYLKFLKKDREFNLMMENYRLIKSELGQLESWLKKNPKSSTIFTLTAGRLKNVNKIEKVKKTKSETELIIDELNKIKKHHWDLLFEYSKEWEIDDRLTQILKDLIKPKSTLKAKDKDFFIDTLKYLIEKNYIFRIEEADKTKLNQKLTFNSIINAVENA